MRVTRTAVITTSVGVLTVYVSLPAKGYTGSMVILSTSWSGETGGPKDGDTKGVISWGDGTSDTILMPIAGTAYSISHTYSITGTKSVSVVVTDPYAGATGTGSASITIVVPLSATLSASPTSGKIPLTVTFAIVIDGGYTPYSWKLDYGNGTPPDTYTGGAGPAAEKHWRGHNYTKAGTFTATLTVTDALGLSLTRTITTFAGVPIPTLLDAVTFALASIPLLVVGGTIVANELQRARVWG